MKINYADRRNDKNIIRKKFILMNSKNDDFKGKVGLIYLEKVNQNFVAKRPNGVSEVIIDNGFKILTYFPEGEAYCCSVMVNKEDQVLQWYFDVLKGNCKFDLDVPYGTDLFLDVILLPNREYYIIDQEDLSQALDNNMIEYSDYNKAYETVDKIENLIKFNFSGLYDFTIKSLNILMSKGVEAK